MMWPDNPDQLVVEQERLARTRPAPWTPPDRPPLLAALFVCFGREGRGEGAGESAWAAAVLSEGHRMLDQAVVVGRAGAAYEPGLLALREGPLLERALASLGSAPELVLVNATGRDHPRRAGLALHLGAVVGLPTVGVTDRPLCASAATPEPAKGSRAPLWLEGELVGYSVRTRAATRPALAHAAWRTNADTAASVVLRCSRRARTPTPLRHARRLARTARAGSAPGRPTP